MVVDGLVRRDARASCWRARPRATRVGFEAAHLTVSRHDWLERALGTAPGTSARRRDGRDRRARARREGRLRARRAAARPARRLSDVAAQRARARCARAGPSARSRSPSTGASARPGSSARRSTRSSPAGRTRRCRTRRPTERKLSEGDLVVLDFGGVYDSYCVDLTRTVSVGPASRTRPGGPRRRCSTAHDRAIAACRPGQSRFAIDAAARDGAGARPAWPRRSATAPGTAWGSRCTRIPASPGAGRDIDTPATKRVAPGMVFTIEPGAYFPGLGRRPDRRRCASVTDDGRRAADRRDDGAAGA